MKFIFRWLGQKIRQAGRGTLNSPSSMPCVSEEDVVRSDGLQSNGTHFTVYKADGGFVVETRHHDRNHDRQLGLYIITGDQNFGERIENIITYEALKR